MKRLISLVVAASAVAAIGAFALAGGAGASGAHAAGVALPSLNLALNGTSVTVAGPVQSGGVDVVSTVTKVRQAEPTLVRLNPGATVQQAFAAVGAHHGDINYL